MLEVGYSFSSRPRIATIWPFAGSSTRPERGPSARLTTAPWPRRTPEAGTAATTANPWRRSASTVSSSTSSPSSARASARTARQRVRGRTRDGRRRGCRRTPASSSLGRFGALAGQTVDGDVRVDEGGMDDLAGDVDDGRIRRDRCAGRAHGFDDAAPDDDDPRLDDAPRSRDDTGAGQGIGIAVGRRGGPRGRPT